MLRFSPLELKLTMFSRTKLFWLNFDDVIWEAGNSCPLVSVFRFLIAFFMKKNTVERNILWKVHFLNCNGLALGAFKDIVGQLKLIVISNTYKFILKWVQLKCQLVNYNAAWRTSPTKQDLLRSMQHTIFNKKFYTSFIVVFDVQMFGHLTQPLKNIYWRIEGISPNMWQNPASGEVFIQQRDCFCCLP